MKACHLVAGTMVFALTFASAAAAKDAYACLESDSVGFGLEKGRYKRGGFNTDKFTMVRDGMALTIKENGQELTYSCQIGFSSRPEALSCSEDFTFMTFNTKTLKFARSFMYGHTIQDGDSVTVSLGECQEF